MTNATTNPIRLTGADLLAVCRQMPENYSPAELVMRCGYCNSNGTNLDFKGLQAALLEAKAEELGFEYVPAEAPQEPLRESEFVNDFRRDHKVMAEYFTTTLEEVLIDMSEQGQLTKKALSGALVVGKPASVVMAEAPESKNIVGTYVSKMLEGYNFEEQDDYAKGQIFALISVLSFGELIEQHHALDVEDIQLKPKTGLA